MDRGFSPLKAMLGLLAIGVIGVLGFLVLQGVKPTIKNAVPVNGSRTNQGDVTISAEARGEANLQGVRLRVDSKNVDDPVIKANSERFWQVQYTSPLPRGQHDVELTVTDVRGREQTYRWRFTAAGPASPPKFGSPLPPNGARLPQGDVALALDAFSEVAALDSFSLTLNGVKVAAPTPKGGTNERTTASVLRALDPGQYSAQAEATDKNGGHAVFQWQFTVAAAGGSNDTLFFKDTGFYVLAPFAAYWAQNGGLAIFGLPITAAADQNGRTVQWFERARFERATGSQQVQLGLLGNELRTADPPLSPPPSSDRLFFSQTGHSLGGSFRAYWEAHGGLAVFGLPLTEEITEDGRRVQWFERARFEYNPQGAGTPNEVVLGQLGRTRLAQTGR
jgi:hypothetical protein